MKYFIHTTGCKANQWDTHVISENLNNAGLSRTSIANADFVIINACTLTMGAERDIRRFINRVHRENPGSRIVLAGCHGQVFPDNAFGADLVLGHEEKFRITEFLNKTGVFRSERDAFSLENPRIGSLQSGKTRFFLKIQDGCDNFCTYCVVPYARGIPRSRHVGEIIQIMEFLKRNNVHEVVLTGIEISAYHDSLTGIDLKGLLQILEKTETPPRIRMSSLDPLFVDDGFVNIVSKSEKISKSVHIPLQSGSETILKRMGRRYTPAFITNVIVKLRDSIPDIGVGFDVITGFPGEDDDKFNETVSFLNSSDIYYLHVFPFSARPGTAACSMDSRISESEKKRRVHVLKNIDQHKREHFYRRFIGRQARIVPEGKTYHGKYMRGYTESYVPVYIPYEKRLENRIIEVTIEGIKDGLLVGSAKGAEHGVQGNALCHTIHN